ITSRSASTMKATAVILLFLVIFGITRCLCKGKLAKRVKPQEIKKIELFHMSRTTSCTHSCSMATEGEGTDTGLACLKSSPVSNREDVESLEIKK
uniref:Uncharacterized protein n=1 Tax=Astyanax mexicanus TaxID=7994 RepID=A0A8B9L9U8_ASTMX